MTASPNKMSDGRKHIGKRELREMIETTWYASPSANVGFGRIMVIIDQYAKQVARADREAYAIEARLDEAERILGYDIFGTMQRLERTNDAMNRRIAELREKVGRDDTK